MGRIAAERVAGTCLLLIVLLAAIALPQHEAAARQPTKGQIAYVRNAEMYLSSNQGGPPRLWSGPPPPLALADREQGMPSTGLAQANDLLAWGALAACIAIAAGLVLISRRRKDRDGL